MATNLYRSRSHIILHQPLPYAEFLLHRSRLRILTTIRTQLHPEFPLTLQQLRIGTSPLYQISPDCILDAHAILETYQPYNLPEEYDSYYSLVSVYISLYRIHPWDAIAMQLEEGMDNLERIMGKRKGLDDVERWECYIWPLSKMMDEYARWKILCFEKDAVRLWKVLKEYIEARRDPFVNREEVRELGVRVMEEIAGPGGVNRLEEVVEKELDKEEEDDGSYGLDSYKEDDFWA